MEILQPLLLQLLMVSHHYKAKWNIVMAFLFLGGALGDCISDQFMLTSPGNSGSPVICGFNTGQHSNAF